jgi:hypothetical protein
MTQQQRSDFLLGVVNQVSILTKHVGSVCAHLFEKPGGFKEYSKDKEQKKEAEKETPRSSPTRKEETQPHYSSLFQEFGYTPHSHMFDYILKFLIIK